MQDYNQKLTIIGLVLSIVVGSGYYLYNNCLAPKPPQISLEPLEISNNSAVSKEVIVCISGAVKNEGVYKLFSQSRVCDVVSLAGGAAALADFSSINLAERLKDGQKIHIPHKNIQREGKIFNDKKPAKNLNAIGSKKININTANISELDALPGVGAATAKKIISNRPFNTLQDLLKIPRFGEKKIEKIKDLIVF